MRTLGLFIAITALTVSTAEAHHKPGHQMPPGQMKKHVTVQAPQQVPAPVVVQPIVVENPDLGGWQRYVDASYDFTIDLPVGLFEQGDPAARGVHLRESRGLAEMEIYGADNPRRLTPRAFVNALEGAEPVDEVTYRAEGRSWFVLSGYYADDDGVGEPLIFYTKFMFSADLTRVSAFELSYPQSEKRRFDPIVERIEKSLTAPR